MSKFYVNGRTVYQVTPSQKHLPVASCDFLSAEHVRDALVAYENRDAGAAMDSLVRNQLIEENERLKYWLQIACEKSAVPDHVRDGEDRAWEDAAAKFSDEHMLTTHDFERVNAEYEDTVLAAAREASR